MGVSRRLRVKFVLDLGESESATESARSSYWRSLLSLGGGGATGRRGVVMSWRSDVVRVSQGSGRINNAGKAPDIFKARVLPPRQQQQTHCSLVFIAISSRRRSSNPSPHFYQQSTRKTCGSGQVLLSTGLLRTPCKVPRLSGIEEDHYFRSHVHQETVTALRWNDLTSS